MLYTIVFCSILTACDWNAFLIRNKADDAIAPAHKTSLVLGNGEEPETLDPQMATDVSEIQILRDLFEGLVNTDKNGKVIPAIALSWKSHDGKHWLFHLRKDARWSNGDVVRAQDFVYSWQRLADPKTASPSADYLINMQVENAEAIVHGKKSVSTLGIKALDDTTLLITLKRPLPYLPSMLISPAVFPVHAPTIKRFANKWTHPNHWVSNGPYRLKRWYIANRIIAEKNPYYWDRKHVSIKEVVYLPISQPMFDVINYMSGREDITYNAIPPELYSHLKTNYKDELKPVLQLCTYYYEFNINKKPFNDERVREALNLLIDRDLIVNKIVKTAQSTYSFTPSYINNFSKVKPQWASLSFSQRKERARELLKAAGFDDSHPLRFELLYNSKPLHKTVALAMVAQWKMQLPFIQASLVNLEMRSYLAAKRNGSFDLIRRSWCGDYNEPSAFLNVYKSHSSYTAIAYHNAVYDALLASSLQQNLSNEQRRKLYIQAEKQLMKDNILITLFHLQMPRLVKPYILGNEGRDSLGYLHIKDIHIRVNHEKN